MKKTVTRLLALVLALIFAFALVGCGESESTTDPTESTTTPTTEPTTEPEKITVTEYKDLAYGSDEAQTLDLYVPSNAATQADNGVILVLHGGAWIAGNSTTLADDWQDWADQGYIVASMNYRMPEYSISDFTSAFIKYGGVSAIYQFYTDLASQGINAYSICDDIDSAISYSKYLGTFEGNTLEAKIIIKDLTLIIRL